MKKLSERRVSETGGLDTDAKGKERESLIFVSTAKNKLLNVEASLN